MEILLDLPFLAAMVARPCQSDWLHVMTSSHTAIERTHVRQLRMCAAVDRGSGG